MLIINDDSQPLLSFILSIFFNFLILLHWERRCYSILGHYVYYMKYFTNCRFDLTKLDSNHNHMRIKCWYLAVEDSRTWDLPVVRTNCSNKVVFNILVQYIYIYTYRNLKFYKISHPIKKINYQLIIFGR